MIDNPAKSPLRSAFGTLTTGRRTDRIEDRARLCDLCGVATWWSCPAFDTVLCDSWGDRLGCDERELLRPRMKTLRTSSLLAQGAPTAVTSGSFDRPGATVPEEVLGVLLFEDSGFSSSSSFSTSPFSTSMSASLTMLAVTCRPAQDQRAELDQYSFPTSISLEPPSQWYAKLNRSILPPVGHSERSSDYCKNGVRVGERVIGDEQP